MSEIILPGLSEINLHQYEGMPEISDRYCDVIENLVLSQNDGVTVFKGGPLDLESGRNVWLSPVEVDDSNGFSNFQVIFVNTRPEQVMGVMSVPVTVLKINETSYKLTPEDHPINQRLMSQFSGEGPHVFIRRCNTGMAYYPRVATPNSDPKMVARHTEKLIKTMELPPPQVVMSLSAPSVERTTFQGIDGISQFTHARTYEFGKGKVHSYGIVLDEDPWRYYEVFTTRPLEYMLESSTDDNLAVRIDSGCDTGQLFADRGCDCREQLHTALHSMQCEEDNNGIVIHIPSQDGRGYGVATKMETELSKRGLARVRGRRKLGVVEPVDTVVAAEALLGPNFDMRNYTGAGRLLNLMGIQTIRLRTENRRKVADIQASGIEIYPIPTETTGANGSHAHIKAKHSHPMYFDHQA